jgi:hypothetical protein
MKSVLPKYFSSQWSFAQFRTAPGRDSSRSIVAFGAEKNTIIVVSDDGTFYKAMFDTATGTCSQVKVCVCLCGRLVRGYDFPLLRYHV